MIPLLKKLQKLACATQAVTRWRMVFGLIIVFCAVYLLAAPKPWTIDLVSKHRVLNYWAYYSWVAAVPCLLAGVLLFMVAPWWAGRKVDTSGPIVQAPRWFWPLVVAAMVLQGVFAFPRLNDGLWDDEELNVRKSILGNYKLRKDDEPVKFQKLDWSSTMLEYREPNNHVLNSLLARACHEAWQAVAPSGQGLPFAEWSLRIPSFVTGVLSIGGVAWFLLVFGMPRAGAFAAFLACLHPWYLRYTAECRGYPFALLLVPVILGLWHRCVFRGGWKWWAALGLAQFALVYAYPGTLFVLVVLHALTVPVLFMQKGAPIRDLSGRWFCTNALTAIVAIPLLLPLLPQMKAYLQYQSEQGFVMGKLWLWNEVHYFLSGVPWSRGSSASAAYPEVVYTMGSFLWVYFLFMVVALLFFAFGVWRFGKLGPAGWAVVFVICLPPLMTFGLFRLKTQILYESYVVYALPGFLALIAAGAEGLLARLPGLRSKNRGQVAVLGALVLAYGALTQSTRSWMRNHPLQQLPESVLASRGSLVPDDPGSEKILTGSFCIPPYLYDPRMIRLDSTVEFVEFLKKADEEGRPLFINLGMPWAAEEYSPGMWALVTDSTLFEAPTAFRGWDPGLDRLVFKYKPGSSRDYDFSKVIQKSR